MNEWINKLASKSINQSIINKYGQFSWAQKKLLCNQCRHISWSFFMFVWRKFISLRKSTHAFCSQLFFSYLRFPQNLCVCCEQGSNIFESFPESLAGQALQSVASELIRVLGEKWRHNDSAAVNQKSITIKWHLTGMCSSMHFLKGYSMVTKLPLLSIYLHMDWDKKTARCDKRSMQLPSGDPVAITLQRLRNHALAVCRVIATKLLIMKRWSGTKSNHSDTRRPGWRNFQKVILRESKKGCLCLKLPKQDWINHMRIKFY